MTKKVKTATLALCGIALVVLIVQRLLGPPAIEDQAASFHHGIEEGNVGVLTAYGLPDEKRVLELTPEKIDRVWKEVVLPLRRDWKKSGGIEVQRTLDGGEGTAYQEYTDGKGRHFSSGTELFATDEGPKGGVSDAIDLTFAMTYAPDDTPHGYMIGRAVGARRWASKLDSLGITGTYVHGERVPWIAYAASCEDQARRMDRVGTITSDSTGTPPAP